MNLADMVTQVGLDTGYLDTDDVSYARTALRQRDELLWRMGLWKDSLVQVTVAVDPENNEDHAEGVLYLPAIVERVVAVRTADTFLRVSGLETFYRADYDKFIQTGVPVEFAKLAPAWFTARHSPAPFWVAFYSQDPTDAGVNVRIIWRDADDERHVLDGALSAPGDEPALECWSTKVTIEALFKPVTTYPVYGYTYNSIYADGWVNVAAADTRSPMYQRIRIFPIPTAAGSLRVLAKANYVPLTFDQQEPAITGSHLCLMAFAKHLLYKRGGESVPAGEALQEAMGLLETLKREEMQQEANNQRIIPDSGFGEAFFGPGRDGYFLGG